MTLAQPLLSAGDLHLELIRVTEGGRSLPWGGYGAVALAAIAATLLATAAALPLLRASGRPGALRTE